MNWHDVQGIREARELALRSGMTLIRRVEHQYCLRGPGWLLQLFPDDQRIYRGHDQGAPRFELPTGWTILDAVTAAAGAVAAGTRQAKETSE